MQEEPKRVDAVRIAELAELTGVTRRTIRYYVSQGLLPPPDGHGPSRVYGHEHYVRLLLIRRLRDEHLPLEEIRRCLAGLSLRQMERLLETAPPPSPRQSISASRLLSAVLGSPVEGAEQEAGAGMLRERLVAARERERRARSPAAPPPAPGEGDVAAARPPETLPVSAAPWRRVALAPGIELHYQLSEDPRAAAAVERIISAAARVLREERDGGTSGIPEGEGPSGGSWFHRPRPAPRATGDRDGTEGSDDPGKDRP